jgi:hypothetical protein
MLIHVLGFLAIGIGLAAGGIYFYQWQYWLVLFGATIVYLNALI